MTENEGFTPDWTILDKITNNPDAPIVRDEQFYDELIFDVKEDEDNWSLEFGEGLHLSCQKISDQGTPVRTPVPGDYARLYGRGFGHSVRGIFLIDPVTYGLEKLLGHTQPFTGDRVWYMTVEEEEAKHQRWCDEYAEKQRREYEEHQEERNAKVAALPEMFRQRIENFRTANPKFIYEYEPYEVFCCEQATIFARLFPTLEALKEFHDMSWNDQVAHFTDPEERAAFEGHSGNTFGCACALARQYLSQPENILRLPGALSPLVGSAAYEGTEDGQ